MRPHNTRRWLGFMLISFICFVCCTNSFQNFLSFPSQLRLFKGQEKELKLLMPVSAQMSVTNPKVVHLKGNVQTMSQVNLNEPLLLQSGQTGQSQLTLKLFGAIPIKTLRVNVFPDLKVIPGGQTIGVKLKSAGILVVGYHLVSLNESKKISPGEEAKVQVGDLIVSINGIAANDVTKVAEMVADSGKSKQPLELLIERNRQMTKVLLQPIYDYADKAYRLGLYIRDSAAGIGTLTFYAPDQQVYGALGHVITDMDTQMPITAGGGEIVDSHVTSIAKSQHGEPGEKRATFNKDSKVIGNIEKNTSFGIFGKMAEQPAHGFFNEPIPVAFAEDVKTGPAQIYTVINGQTVEKFNIEIMHVNTQQTPATKGLVIKITDRKLLEKTGGIVQGMSGSPIVQNGKLVGAVTHVFVNDPTSGYGCFIEWMLQDAGILLPQPANAPEYAA